MERIEKKTNLKALIAKSVGLVDLVVVALAIFGFVMSFLRTQNSGQLLVFSVGVVLFLSTGLFLVMNRKAGRVLALVMAIFFVLAGLGLLIQPGDGWDKWGPVLFCGAVATLHFLAWRWQGKVSSPRPAAAKVKETAGSAPDKLLYCPACGSTEDEEEGVRFCHLCGATLVKREPPAAKAVEPVEAVAEEVPAKEPEPVKEPAAVQRTKAEVSTAGGKKRINARLIILASLLIILSVVLFFDLTRKGRRGQGNETAPTTLSPGSSQPEANPTSRETATTPIGSGQEAGEEMSEAAVTGMEFVWVPAGEFDMGYEMGNPNEKPVHRVYVDGFWMGKYEVTQGEWEKVMGSKPSYHQGGSDYPVEQVSWDNVQEFIHHMNDRTGLIFRLPTEAEWEYACRAGTTGNEFGDLKDIAWYTDTSEGSTHPVGQKQANAFGLYDMLGNVGEWCQDWFGDYSDGYQTNPSGDDFGSYRIFRGGSWGCYWTQVYPAFRDSSSPQSRGNYIGFRLATKGEGGEISGRR